jgi:hypothetical protein
MLNNSLYSLFTVLKMIAFIFLYLLGILPGPYKGIALFLDGSLKPHHLPLLAGREFAGVMAVGEVVGAQGVSFLLGQAAVATSQAGLRSCHRLQQCSSLQH